MELQRPGVYALLSPWLCGGDMLRHGGTHGRGDGRTSTSGADCHGRNSVTVYRDRYSHDFGLSLLRLPA